MPPRKSLKDEEQSLLRELQRGGEYAARNVLDLFARWWRSGAEMSPQFESVVLGLLAKAVFEGHLPPSPPSPKGRKLTPMALWKANEVACEYYRLVDSGQPSDVAVASISARVHKSERHVMRQVALGREWAGTTLRERVKRREGMARFAEAMKTAKRPANQKAEDEAKLIADRLNDPIVGVYGVEHRLQALILDALEGK